MSEIINGYNIFGERVPLGKIHPDDEAYFSNPMNIGAWVYVDKEGYICSVPDVQVSSNRPLAEGHISIQIVGDDSGQPNLNEHYTIFRKMDG